MELKNVTYLLLLFIFVVIPFIINTKNRIYFVSNLKYLLPAILFSGAVFALWNVRFTELGIWRFNLACFTGITIMNLPLEEWMFFFVFPFSSVYIYEFLNAKHRQFEMPNLFLSISLVLLIVFVIITYHFRQKLYTFFTFFLLCIYFGYTIFRNRFKKHYTKFYLTFVLVSVPYLVFASVLNYIAAVSYHPDHIIGLNILNVPVENFGHIFLFLLMNITIFEYLKERQFY